MKKFKWVKFFTYLSMGLVLLGGWGYINYLNYTEINQAAQLQIDVNNVLIDSTVEEIEMQQMELRMEQRVMVEAPAPMMEPPMASAAPPILSRESRAPASVAPSPPPHDDMYDELQARIDQLEKERQYFLNEKGRIAKEIQDVMSLFKVDVKNPFMNIVLLPLFAYFMKKVFDFIFNRLEERFHHEA